MQEFNLLNEELILIRLEAEKREEVLKALANLLISSGYVKESFLEAILEREKVFPTGLPTEGVGVAIPHADIIHVVKPAIAIGVLNKPVKFSIMGNPEEEVDVKLVFMLAINEPTMQINLLKSLVSLFQDKKLLHQLSETKNKKELISILSRSIKVGILA
ncbi:PTS system, galactitol-specific IIA component [Caldanaerovirga acetigignens]|uniref:PTS system, galactitol-specific IIA component n=1 Tax=Caldanaerovirga acetigignens TaxID=447595 RepID=A0A1M7M0E6_9FIRM|nr:PTS sugar transporter subunit IIA [Caldanaerovirga acetigignens]SHM83599.1 PTS system, galactitol-specific IIA component [Caldanaerovirga acetigignens]